MSKKKDSYAEELDHEFYAQIDFLRADYDQAQIKLEQQKKDIKRLIALMIENDLAIPGDIIDQYICRAPEIKEPEDLPFD
jgi:hypothetical protein